jgi:predicted nicotinamide N-methyase
MPGYDTKQEQVAVQGVDDLHIRSLLDRQQFADDSGEAAALGISSAMWPLFGLLWPSGRQLARHMAGREVQSGERILEIGCGLALASLVSHRRGADVTASDCHPLTEAFLGENLRLNDLPPMAYRHGPWDGTASPSGYAHRSGVHGRYDLIIGSDVLYERDDGGVLPAFIERHAHDTACVMIVDPDRGNRSAFNRRMDAMGFELVESRLDEAASALGAAYKGRLMRYQRTH